MFLSLVLQLIINQQEKIDKLLNFCLYLTGQFTEDGSFIGQYVPGKLQQPVSPITPHNIPLHLSTVSQKPLSPNSSGNGSNTAAVATYV